MRKGAKGERREKWALHAQATSTAEGGRSAEIVGYAVRERCGQVSRSSEGLEMMTTVIVTSCSLFRLTVSEAKTEIMCMQTKGGGKVSFSTNAAGQVYKHAIEFANLGEAITADRDLSIEIPRRLQRAWACSSGTR